MAPTVGNNVLEGLESKRLAGRKDVCVLMCVRVGLGVGVEAGTSTLLPHPHDPGTEHDLLFW